MLNWICPKCGRKILLPSKVEINRGWCSMCEVDSWSPEKRSSLRAVIGAFAKGATQEEMNKKIDESLKYVR